MSQEHLGLFDTPPDRREIRIALVLMGLLLAALAILSAIPDVRLRQVDAFIPMVDAIMFLGDLIIATLLYVQASVFRSRALNILASGYVFCASLLVAHMLTFPGAFAPDGLLGAKTSTTAWIALFWRAGFPITIILYAALKRTEPVEQPPVERPSPRIAVGLFAAIALAVAITILAIRANDSLPQIFLNRYEVNRFVFVRLNLVLIAVMIVALVALFTNRRSVLGLWLLVALSSLLAHAILNMQSYGRFTVGFYGQFVMLLTSHLVVLLALIVESSWLYARLAASTAAHNREREARLLSMDAVAAAMSHEAGQPLSAAILNAQAGLNLLTRSRPDRQRAIKALRATIDDGQRTFDVIKSIRAMFARGPVASTEFSLNELVSETALLLDRELAARKVSLLLALDETLPPIQANRVQMQRVLINLITNAIESMGTTRSRSRRVTISSALVDDREVLLEVTDTGTGIGPAEMGRIFETFFTTKETGTGLGLSLCRNIIEEHGGRLWASPGEESGATLHLRLPRSGFRTVTL